MDNKYGAHAQGTAAIAAVGTTAVIAAATGKYLWVQKVIITIAVQAATATFSIDDGTTAFIGPILAKDGNGTAFEFDFGEEGYKLATGLGVWLTNGTANGTARATVIARKIG